MHNHCAWFLAKLPYLAISSKQSNNLSVMQLNDIISNIKAALIDTESLISANNMIYNNKIHTFNGIAPN